MVKTSKFTKKTRTKYWVLKCLHLILLFVPLIVYVIIALGNGGITAPRKIAVVGTVMIALILTVFNFLAKRNLRSPIWLVLLGLYVAMKEYLIPLVIILACVSVLDDFVLSPMIANSKIALESSKMMDKRQAEENPIVEEGQV